MTEPYELALPCPLLCTMEGGLLNLLFNFVSVFEVASAFLLSAYCFPFLGVYAPVFPVMKSGSAECFDSELNLQLEFKGKPFQLL